MCLLSWLYRSDTTKLLVGSIVKSPDCWAAGAGELSRPGLVWTALDRSGQVWIAPGKSGWRSVFSIIQHSVLGVRWSDPVGISLHYMYGATNPVDWWTNRKWFVFFDPGVTGLRKVIATRQSNLYKTMSGGQRHRRTIYEPATSDRPLQTQRTGTPAPINLPCQQRFSILLIRT